MGLRKFYHGERTFVIQQYGKLMITPSLDGLLFIAGVHTSAV
jgi:hypothetical protein